MHFVYGLIFAHGSIGASVNCRNGMFNSMCVESVLFKAFNCQHIYFRDSR
jgi:hypothetical protein